jgi:uncharacterized membrane protein YgaE (UPF0421/DUF939 family)
LPLGGGYGTLALATFVAMAIARALGGARVTVAQAAAGAILTVAVANGEAGPDRLVDALIGAGVALVFSQLLFSPEPVALLRRAEAAALADIRPPNRSASMRCASKARGAARAARHAANDLHLLAMAFFVGGQLFLVAAVVPSLRADDDRDRLRAIARRFGWGTLAAITV